MTTRPSPSSQSVTEEASAWVIRLGGDDVTHSDYIALESWLDASPEHRPAFEAAEALWVALDDDRGALDAALTRAAGVTTSTLSALSRNRAPARGRRWQWAAGGLSAAAAVVCAILLAPALASRTVVYVTAPGEQKTVSLADGSTIAMNGASKLSVRLTGRERLVEMASAEASFDVARDASRPFRVTVGQSRIEVLGTAFDVRRDAEETRVSVTRGLVRVSDLKRPAHAVRLTPGQTVARADASGILQVTTGDITTAGWRTGRLVYNQRPLSEVVADLSRAYPTPVRALGDTGGLRFTGVLTLDGQASTLRQLETFLPVSASEKAGAIELRPR